MIEVEKFNGLNGNLMAFKREVGDAEKVTFVGIPNVCSPFAQLFAYVIKDKESVFMARTDKSTARKMEQTPLGMQFSDEADPHSNVVALLGGLSLPKYKVNVEEVQKLIDDILTPNGKLMGLCYMNMFGNAGWDELIDFDCIINGVLTGEVYKK